MSRGLTAQHMQPSSAHVAQVVEPDDDDEGRGNDRQATVVHNVASIERAGDLSVAALGQHLADAKDPLQTCPGARDCVPGQMACPRRGHRHVHTIRYVRLRTQPSLRLPVSDNPARSARWPRRCADARLLGCVPSSVPGSS